MHGSSRGTTLSGSKAQERHTVVSHAHSTCSAQAGRQAGRLAAHTVGDLGEDSVPGLPHQLAPVLGGLGGDQQLPRQRPLLVDLAAHLGGHTGCGVVSGRFTVCEWSTVSAGGHALAVGAVWLLWWQLHNTEHTNKDTPRVQGPRCTRATQQRCSGAPGGCCPRSAPRAQSLLPGVRNSASLDQGMLTQHARCPPNARQVDATYAQHPALKSLRSGGVALMADRVRRAQQEGGAHAEHPRVSDCSQGVALVWPRELSGLTRLTPPMPSTAL
jgi:hypothetical protein